MAAAPSSLVVARTTQFKKDYKRVSKRGADIATLESVIRALIAGETLDPSYKTHPLKGEWKDHLECHLGGDFLLIWRVQRDTITFVRTGTHQDLFGR